MKKVIPLLLSLVMLLAMLAGCASDPQPTDEATPKLTIGVSGEYYPFCYTENDVLQGYEIDFWNEFGTRNGYKISFVTSDFTGLFGMLDSGKIDTIGYGIAVNAERSEKYQFSEPYLYSNYNVVTLKGSDLTELEDFVGGKIGVVMGGEGERRLTALCADLGLDIDVVGYEGPAPLDEDVRLGRLDARLAPQIQTAANIVKNDLDFTITDIVIYTETDAYPFPKDTDQTIITAVNETIQAMQEDGTLAALSETWFNIDATKPVD